MALVPLQAAIDSSAPGLSSRSNRKYVSQYEFDRMLTERIFSFYNEKEPKFSEARDYRFAHVFHGNFRIEWGGGDINPIVLNNVHERDDLESLFREALSYRDMFGMVPIKVRGRGKSNAGKPMIRILPFGSGDFVVEYDRRHNEVSVFYRVAIPHGDGRGGGVGAHMNRNSVNGRPAGYTNQPKQSAHYKYYDVFVWPNHEPTISGVMSGSQKSVHYKSRVARLYPQYARISELRANMLKADFSASHPIVITQTKADNRKVDELLEEEDYGAADDPDIVGPDEQKNYRRNVHRAIQQEQMLAAMNAAAHAGIDPDERDETREVIDSATNEVTVTTRPKTFDGAAFNLPAGEELTQGIRYSSRTDIMGQEDDYTNAVFRSMGTPRHAVEGVTGARAKGDADQMRQVLRIAVMQDRSDVGLFYSFAYERANRGSDDELMFHALISADKNEENEQGPDEKKRMREIRANISKISAMPYRTRVVFQEDPLPKKVEIPTMEKAIQYGALTRLEQVNIMRAEMGLPTIDKDHEILRGDGADPTTTVATIPEEEEEGGGASAAAAESKDPKKPKEPKEPKKPKDSSKNGASSTTTEKDDGDDNAKAKAKAKASKSKKSSGSKRQTPDDTNKRTQKKARPQK